MAEELATQIVEPGDTKPSISKEDEVDVICILHPTSKAAYDIVDKLAETSPQHILQKQEILSTPDDDPWPEYDLDPEFSESAAQGQPPFIKPDPERQQDEKSSLDIALRLSSSVKDVCLGFRFGRSVEKCDVVLDDDVAKKRISLTHFRIYLTKEGIIMLEDTSSNGTLVDRKLLRYKDGPASSNRHMLTQSTVIELASNDQTQRIKFVVSIPARRDLSEWQRKLHEYLEFVERAERRAHAERDMKKATVQRPFAHLASQVHSSGAILTAGSERFNHGMHWNGGDKYNVVSHIGKGAFANVYKLATKADGHIYAVKELEKRKMMKNGVLDIKFHNELMIMKDIDHPHIVKYFDYQESPHHLYIVMEFVPVGDLLRHMNTYGAITEPQGRLVARQMCQALRYLHRVRITHRDIKPDNILIQQMEPMIVKLSDFGLSKVTKGDVTVLKTFCGTLLYCAPEVYPDYERLRNGQARKRRHAGDQPPVSSPYSPLVDMWSLAAVLFHLLSNSPPYPGSGEDRGATMLENIMRTRLDLDPLKQAKVSDSGVEFLRALLRTAPGLRPSAQQCFEHPWIEDVGDLLDIPKELDQTIDFLDDIPEEHDDEALDASRLSLLDKGAGKKAEGAGTIQDHPQIDEIHYARLSKRLKNGEVSRGAGLEGENGTVNQFSLSADSDGQFDSDSGMIDGYQPALPQQPGRLFGEIAPADIASSGALGAGHHVPRMLDRQATRDTDADWDVAPPERQGSDGSYDGTTELGETFLRMLDHATRHPSFPLPPSFGSTPSLQGAVAQIDALNMTSPESGISPAATPRTPTTPVSRKRSPSASSGVADSERSSQAIDAGENGENNEEDENEETPRRANAIASAASASSASSASPSKFPRPSGSLPLGPVLPSSDTPRPTMESAAAASDFVKPVRPLGKLTTVPNSVPPATTLFLEKRWTSYGRDPGSDYRYPNGLDTRVPKAAMDIVFWRSGIEREIDNGAELWTMPDVVALITTRARGCIWVNDVRLTRGDGTGWLYGVLKHGDVVTIFNDDTGSLRFRCEFYHGLSKEVRGPGDVFTVEKEVKKFEQMLKRRSCSVESDQPACMVKVE